MSLSSPLVLDSFEAVDIPYSPPDRGYERGFEEGKQAAIDEFLDHQAQLTEAHLCLLQEMSFTYAEARSQLVSGLSPLFQAIADQLLPGLRVQSLALKLAHDIAEYENEILSAPLHIFCPKEMFDALSTELGNLLGQHLKLSVNDRLNKNEIRWSANSIHRSIDLDPVISGIIEGLEIITQTKEGKFRNG